jgi:diacylglycerol kinase
LGGIINNRLINKHDAPGGLCYAYSITCDYKKMKRLIKSFNYAFRGLIKVFKEEGNFKIQTFLAVLAVFLGFILKIERFEWLVIVIVIGLVLLTETLNSAVERVSDALKPRIDSYVKEIKDIMAAAVVISATLAVIVGMIVFLPYIYEFLK